MTDENQPLEAFVNDEPSPPVYAADEESPLRRRKLRNYSSR